MYLEGPKCPPGQLRIAGRGCRGRRSVRAFVRGYPAAQGSALPWTHAFRRAAPYL